MVQQRNIALCIILSLVTCGIYGIYWVYTAGSKIDEAKTARGIPSSNSNVLYLILNLVGLAIVTDALIQNELNNMAGAQPTA